MIALSPREEWDYVLHDDRGASAPTVFRLRPLSLRERNEADDLTGRHERDGIPYGTWATIILRAGLVGWTHLKDSKGADVRFGVDRNGKATDETLERLPSAVCMELAVEIMRRSQVSEADRKN